MKYLNEIEIYGIPCTHQEIETLKELTPFNMLPDAYIEFLKLAGRESIFSFGGYNALLHSKESANIILSNERSSLKLCIEDFVFWIDPGGAFAFFKVNQDPNPPVYYYRENCNQETFNLISESFSNFLFKLSTE